MQDAMIESEQNDLPLVIVGKQVCFQVYSKVYLRSTKFEELEGDMQGCPVPASRLLGERVEGKSSA